MEARAGLPGMGLASDDGDTADVEDAAPMLSVVVAAEPVSDVVDSCDWIRSASWSPPQAATPSIERQMMTRLTSGILLAGDTAATPSTCHRNQAPDKSPRSPLAVCLTGLLPQWS